MTDCHKVKSSLPHPLDCTACSKRCHCPAFAERDKLHMRPQLMRKHRCYYPGPSPYRPTVHDRMAIPHSL